MSILGLVLSIVSLVFLCAISAVAVVFFGYWAVLSVREAKVTMHASEHPFHRPTHHLAR